MHLEESCEEFKRASWEVQKKYHFALPRIKGIEKLMEGAGFMIVDSRRIRGMIYTREESAWRFCHRKLKRAYPYAQYRLVSGYGHVGYPGEHPEEYCGWLSALARGEALPGA